MKALLSAALILTAVGSTSPARANLNCTYNTFTGEAERCTGYSYELGSYTVEPTGLGSDIRTRTDSGNNYVCNQFGTCRAGY